MGYIKHNSIIYTCFDKEDAIKAHKKAKEIFSVYQDGTNHTGLVSEIITYIINEGYSFFIAPDGSKEGWLESDNCDNSRSEFLEWIKSSGNYGDYIEIRFGGDDEENYIVRTNNTDCIQFE